MLIRLKIRDGGPVVTTEFKYDVFLSHSSKDKAVVRAASLSASTGERVGVRCRRLHLLRPAGLRLWFDEWECPSLAEVGGRDRCLCCFALSGLGCCVDHDSRAFGPGFHIAGLQPC